MITYTQGNLLEAQTDALVNTVNTVGVMGKGIALMFKERFPKNMAEYASACKAKQVNTGKMFVTQTGELMGPQWIVNFPTKQHWRAKSKMEWIQDGLIDLRHFLEANNVSSIAIPPLGAGQGGLSWPDVKVEIEKALLPEEDKKRLTELKERIKDAHFVGIRSRTQLTADIFDAAEKLIAVGCFCIGTNQVDLKAATERGICVFNAPYSNTRSVAELSLAQAILLMRGVPEKNAQCHRGGWVKSAVNSYEIRGKKLGIVGYGSIGSQLSVLAESLGMKVYFYDIVAKLPLGNASQVRSMKELLSQADVAADALVRLSIATTRLLPLKPSGESNGQCIGGVIGPGGIGEVEFSHHRFENFILFGMAKSGKGKFDLHGRKFHHGHLEARQGHHHHPSSLNNADGGARSIKKEFFDRC